MLYNATNARQRTDRIMNMTKVIVWIKACENTLIPARAQDVLNAVTGDPDEDSVARLHLPLAHRMEHRRLPYQDTGQFQPIVTNYLKGFSELEGLVAFKPTTEGLRAAMARREFPPQRRSVLSKVLERQYRGIDVHEAVRGNLDRLVEDHTLTVTTGHQVCLLTGPLYVPLKILNTVRLAEQLSTDRPVVPILWMATEDHDLAEVDHVFIHGNKIQWQGGGTGAVGRMLLKNIGPVVDMVRRTMGLGSHAEQLARVIEHAYREDRTLAEATRLFVNSIFGSTGIICLDADDAELKREFIPAMEAELLEGRLHRSVAAAEEWLDKKYKVQAPSREINLFHLKEGERSRITSGRSGWMTEAGTTWKKNELIGELNDHPGRFSPNVLLRPLYQETILPNIAYIGGGGEIAYWLQLKAAFEAFDLPMPVLLLRTSLGVIDEKDARRLKKLGLRPEDLFLPIHELQKKIAAEHSGIDLSIEEERKEIAAIYERLQERAGAIDRTLDASVAGAAARSMKGLDHIEKKIVRAAKRRTQEHSDSLQVVLDHFMPGGKLQERRENFMSFYCRYGEGFLDLIKDRLDPLEPVFNIFQEGADQ